MMALPLTPETGMFPDTLVAPFIVAPEVEDLAEGVLASFDEFRPIRDAIADSGLRIRYVFETKAYDLAKEEVKPHTIAKVTKAGPLWKVLAETELVIQFRQWFWEHFSEHERRGVLHHELTHVEVGEDGDGNFKVSLREHDVEEFSQTARRFGPRRLNHQELFKAFLAWEREHEPKEPRKLRPVEATADDIAHMPLEDQAVVVAAMGFKRAVQKLGMDVTIASGGHSATIKGAPDSDSDDGTSSQDDDVDLRPAGEVNPDELRGAAARDVDEAERATDGDDLAPF